MKSAKATKVKKEITCPHIENTGLVRVKIYKVQNKIFKESHEPVRGRRGS